MLCSTRICPPPPPTLPLSDVIDAFEELVESDDLSQALISYFETHYSGKVRGRGSRR